MLYWFIQRFLNSPSRAQSAMECGGLQPDSLSPFRDTQAEAIVFNDDVAPSVTRLLFRSSPSAIVRGVVTHVVNSIYAVVSWATPHIFKEVFKRLSPSITDADSAPTVHRVLMVVRSITSALYLAPYSVLRAAGAPMFERPFSGQLRVKTTTRADKAVYKVAASDYLLLPTIADTIKHSCARIIIRCAAQYNKSIKPLSGKVVKFHGELV